MIDCRYLKLLFLFNNQDKEIDARIHSAELSADDSDSSQSKRNIDGDDAIIRELEKVSKNKYHYDLKFISLLFFLFLKDAVQSLQNERSSISVQFLILHIKKFLNVFCYFLG